ncbi:hypothetical protein CEXT_532771 [Caerostris extrusa]|uniref:Uncharacterized protein n=1 Tax=Caerostris extrusa TaxID=172846 RepID=A0AAV4PD47_CAEEX|nr:hypothetical protein CEXT_532771 [Caerostris extrusa]
MCGFDIVQIGLAALAWLPVRYQDLKTLKSGCERAVEQYYLYRICISKVVAARHGVRKGFSGASVSVFHYSARRWTMSITMKRNRLFVSSDALPSVEANRIW